jgi:hypothetical protein
MQTNFTFLFLIFIAYTPFYAQDLKGLTYTKLSSVDLYYSEGHELEGTFIGQLTDEANAYFTSVLGKTVDQAKLLVLSKSDWGVYTNPKLIYGMPHYSGEGGGLVLAAEDNDFWKMQMPDILRLKAPFKDLFRVSYMLDGEITGRMFFDLLVVHELAHQWQFQGQLFRQRLWLDEVFCNIMLHTFIAEQRGECLGALTLLPRYHVRGNEVSYDYTTLEDFEANYWKLGMEAPHNYGWYQYRFHAAADELYEAGGVEVMVNLWKFLRKHQTRLSDEALIKGLEVEVHPYFGELIANW